MGTVESSPRITFASESPTRIRSAPPSSDKRANSASYADTITSRSPRCFLASTSRTVIRGTSPLPLPIDVPRQRTPQRCQLSLPERAVRKPRVRDDELRGVHDAIIEQHDVQIERARGPARPTHASGRRFDVPQPTEQLDRLQGGFDGNHLIEIRGLGERTEWFRFLHVCHTYHSALRDACNGVARAIEVGTSIAEV